jgi:hypothetical protein
MVRVTGIIIPVDWDDQGNVAHLGIETFDEDFYLIAAETEGFHQLKRLLRKEVELFGTVGRNPTGKVIRVTKYGPIEGRSQGLQPAASRSRVSFH